MAGSLGASAGAFAEDTHNIATWGGAYSQSQEIAFFEPYAKETGTRIATAIYDGTLAKMQSDDRRLAGHRCRRRFRGHARGAVQRRAARNDRRIEPYGCSFGRERRTGFPHGRYFHLRHRERGLVDRDRLRPADLQQGSAVRDRQSPRCQAFSRQAGAAEQGRVEKGKNLQLGGGAGGYILANVPTDDPNLDNTVADDHCLPAVHLGLQDSNKLRAWLGSGSNHPGSMSGFSIFQVPEAGDRIADISSRGPVLPPTQDLLKPDLIAPGTAILGAWQGDGTDFLIGNGPSMASPHVVGGAALLKAVHSNWTPAMIASALLMTATPAHAIDYSPAFFENILSR